jgi:hypothetical protein
VLLILWDVAKIRKKKLLVWVLEKLSKLELLQIFLKIKDLYPYYGEEVWEQLHPFFMVKHNSLWLILHLNHLKVWQSK